MTETFKEAVLKSFIYNEDDGRLYWAIGNHRRNKGEQAGSKSGNGYWYVSINGTRLKASAVINLIKRGYWPIGVMDHIDGNPDNEKWENLQDISQEENLRKAKVRKDNNTGVKGITFLPHGKYRVQKNGKYIGVYPTLELAKQVYDHA